MFKKNYKNRSGLSFRVIASVSVAIPWNKVLNTYRVSYSGENLNAAKNPTEELTVHILFTLVVGYYANAQYDALFIPYRHFVPLPPKEEASFVFASIAKQSPGRVEVYGVYTLPLWSWDISLTLNMTHLFFTLRFLFQPQNTQ